MENRYLTIDSLIGYCKENHISHFSKKETGKSIVVSTFGELGNSINDKFQIEDPGLMPVTLKACHCGINRNNSKISEAVMAKALPSFKNKPILAEIIDGDFGSHAMEYVEDSKGDWFIRYIERAVGIVPESCNARLEYDKEKDRMYTIVDGYIYNYYGNETSDIIKRKNGTKVSVELEVNEFDWDDEDGSLEILDFTFSGVTLLGENVAEGMEGSRLDLSKLPENNTMDYSQQLIEMQSKLDTIIDCFNKDTLGKGDKMLDNETNIVMEETVEEVTETVEKSTIDVSESTTEEIVEEVVEETESTEVAPAEVEVATEEFSEDEVAEETEVETTEDAEGEAEEVVEETVEAEDEVVEETEEVVEETVEVVETVEDEIVEDEVVVEENAEFEALKSEFEEYKANHSYTNEEVEELQNFKADVEFKEIHSKRESVMNDEKYSSISEFDYDEDGNVVFKNEAYGELHKNMDNYSVEELEKELKTIFADHVMNGGNFSQSTEEEVKVTKTLFASTSKNISSKRYGNLF